MAKQRRGGKSGNIRKRYTVLEKFQFLGECDRLQCEANLTARSAAIEMGISHSLLGWGRGDAAALGGRATLLGPIVGAFLVNGAKSWLTVAFPEFWLYFLGALFIAVTLFMPQGVVGLVKKMRARKGDVT